MITQLDNQPWAHELVTGNAQFIEVGSTMFVVSQVRADNTFAIFQSTPTPPAPGAGYAFDIVATYLFPATNTSFDPVITYNADTQILYIVGTQDSNEGKTVDVVIFSFDTTTGFLSAPTTLTTASYIRDSYDVCTLGDNQFVAVAVTNPAQIWQTTTVSQITSISIIGNVLTVTCENNYSVGQQVTFSAVQIATFLNGLTVNVTGSTGSTFTATLSFSPPMNYTQSGYESGYATWLPGHTLLGFELDLEGPTQSPPVSVLVSVTPIDTSPYTSGDAFGAVSAYAVGALTLEIYYETHPKQVTFTDQTFSIKQATYYAPTWATTTLTTFPGRYADSRLTVIPSGSSRVLVQQFYNQLVHQNALIGSLLLGFYNGSQWAFHINSGTTTTSYIQGTLSLTTLETSPPSLGGYIAYLAEPVYSIRGVWSPMVKTYSVSDRVTYNQIDYIVNAAISYNYIGSWVKYTTYAVGAVVSITLPTNPISYNYYMAINSLSSSIVSPNLDTTNWIAIVTPDNDSRFTVAPTAWPLKVSSLNLADFNLTDVPGFFNNLNFTWLRGSKSMLDSATAWGVVGEIEGSVTSGATLVTDLNVPPIAKIVPSGTVSLQRGVPLSFSAAGTNDGDNDTVEFTWSYTPTNANATLLSDSSNATFEVARAIGGAATTFKVAVVAVDYAVIPIHAPMNITNIDVTNNVLTVTVDTPVDLAVTEQVFLYDIINATFLNDTVVAVTGLPSEHQFTANMTYPNYTGTDSGSAIANSQYAFCTVNVPYNAPPTIDFTHDAVSHQPVTIPIVAGRNSTVIIRPTFTGITDPDDVVTYQWVQTTGQTIPSTQILSGLTSAYLEFETNGSLIMGDTVTWLLTVNDGVNAPAVGSVTVNIAAYDFVNKDTLRLSRSMGSGNITQRNSIQTWSALDESVIYTNFRNIKRNSILDGSDRYLLISPYSVSVFGGVQPTVVFLRKLLLPETALIVDAVHTEDDWTLVLDSNSTLYQYTAASFINTDDPDVTINLTDLSSMTFNKMFATFSYGNTRVVMLSGETGLLLLQLRNTDLVLQGTLELTGNSGLVYGSDNVQFIRASNIDSLNTGKLLIGTIAQITATITSVTVADNTVTIEAENNFSSGNVVGFKGITNAVFLNGLTTSVVSANSTLFVISFAHADYATTSEPDGATVYTGGATYETLIDLSHGQVIGTWDAGKLKNQYVTSGEILFEPNDTYGGRPAAPILQPISNGGAVTNQTGYVNMIVSWTANRPDLIQYYNLQISLDNVNWTTTVINSGYLQLVTIPEPIGQMYYIQVQAVSLDGSSPYSNVQTFRS